MIDIEFDDVGLFLALPDLPSKECTDYEFGAFAGSFEINKYGDILSISLDGFKRTGDKDRPYIRKLVNLPVTSYIYSPLLHALRRKYAVKIEEALEDYYASLSADQADFENRQVSEQS